jgi:hypothetical protein
MRKRVISGILALALVLTLTLTLAQADVRVELDGIDGGSAFVTVPEDDSAALLEGYLYQVNGLDVPEVVKAESSGNTASRPATYMASMNPTLRAVYDQLVPEIQKIAAGQGDSSIFELSFQPLTFTKEELGIEGDILVLDKENQYQFSEEANEAVTNAFSAELDVNMLLNQLLARHPYELYWFDKVFKQDDVSAINVRPICSVDGQQTTVTVSDCQILMVVSQDYAVTDADTKQYYLYSPDTAKTGAARTAAAKAAEVVAANQDKGTYSKLVAYAEYIKNAVSYNYAAADKNNGYPYGDPWQLIYVFDGNPDTNVVCEGYSKAFKYLCDLTWTGSDPEVACYLPTGTMDGGDHMWNIVSIGGVNYLADITNCDSGTTGAPDQLFLCGAEGSVDASYAAATTNGTVTYVYDKETLALYDKELVLSATKYSPLAFDLNQLIALARYAAGITTDESAAIDVNNDGIISAADLTAMAQSLVS